MTTDQKQANACQEMKGLVIGMDPGGEAGDNTAVVLRIGSERHILRQPFAGAFIEFAQKAESTQPDKATETHQPDDRPQRERWNLVHQKTVKNCWFARTTMKKAINAAGHGGCPSGQRVISRTGRRWWSF